MNDYSTDILRGITAIITLGIIAAIAVSYLLYYALRWTRNIEQRLQDISDAVQQLSLQKADRMTPNDAHREKNNPATKPSDQPKQDQIAVFQKQPATKQDVAVCFSKHLDARSLPRI